MSKSNKQTSAEQHDNSEQGVKRETKNDSSNINWNFRVLTEYTNAAPDYLIDVLIVHPNGFVDEGEAFYNVGKDHLQYSGFEELVSQSATIWADMSPVDGFEDLAQQLLDWFRSRVQEDENQIGSVI